MATLQTLAHLPLSWAQKELNNKNSKSHEQRQT
jgi:hypothetical protein